MACTPGISFSRILPAPSGRLRSMEPEVVQPDDPPVRPDGNNVNVDSEMAALVKNTLIYNTYVQILANRFSGLRSAITGK